LTVFKDH